MCGENYSQLNKQKNRKNYLSSTDKLSENNVIKPHAPKQIVYA